MPFTSLIPARTTRRLFPRCTLSVLPAAINEGRALDAGTIIADYTIFLSIFQTILTLQF